MRETLQGVEMTSARHILRRAPISILLDRVGIRGKLIQNMRAAMGEGFADLAELDRKNYKGLVQK